MKDNLLKRRLRSPATLRLATIAACLLGHVSVHAAPAEGGVPVSAPVAPCEALAREDFSGLPDAPTQILSSRSVAKTSTQPAYCQIEGYVSSNVGFLLRVPIGHWNGKFLEIGCGGYCGTTDHIVQCEDPLRRGYACIVSDGGHRGGGGKWAYHNLQAILDHYYRAPHVAALVGKAVVERYQGKAPQKSYFIGCSAGGRQAMMEAQRFPWDFDGIVAGAPTFSMPRTHMNMLWSVRAYLDQRGQPLFTEADLELLHRAVLKKCDRNDGLEDGLIVDPRTCGFDPAQLQCRSEKSAQCLTAKQIEAVRKLYDGPRTSQGTPIYMPAVSKGSELTWPLFARIRAAEIFRYIAFQPSPGPAWQLDDFDFDRDYKRFGSEGVISSVNPDLRTFKAAGGKLISYAGWNDIIGMPLHAVDYYETVERTMGGRSATQDFFRLFMIPGMNHCGGGEGAFVVDWLSALEAWVEQGTAPDALVSVHIRGDERRLQFPLDPATIAFSRPVYPYPTNTQYLGHGDPADPKHFGPVNRPVNQ